MLMARVDTGGRGVHALIDLDRGLAEVISGEWFGDFDLTGETVPLERARLLAPVEPSKVLVAGRNYGEPADPALDLVVNLKPSTAVVGPGGPILLPAESADVRFEGELAVVIGRRCRDVPEGDADQVVFGYTCANDVTAWDIGAPGGHWTKAKSFDSFCPLGPWVQTELDSADVAVRTVVNGQLRQDGSTKQLIRGVSRLVARCSQLMTLLPGDVILTGTPDGAGTLNPGDSVVVEIDGIGSLTSPVIRHPGDPAGRR